MTGPRKAVCLFLNFCFAAVLVMLPGPLWPDENIYRQFPVYCFVEDSAVGKSRQKDQETYHLLMENNGAYLGKEIRKENQQKKEQIVDGPEEENITETPEVTEKQKKPTKVPKVTEAPKATEEQKNALETSEVSAKLMDQDYLLNHFFIVDEATTPDAVRLNAGELLGEDLSIRKDNGSPQILIYHSHSQETFVDSREGVEKDTIVGVGDYLTRILTKKYGYQVMHVREAFDMKSGELDRSKAYDYAREYLEPVLAENKSIQVVIDLHRDGVPEDRRLVTEINGKPVAQILFYNGLSYTKQRGSLDYLPNPYIQDNLAFSFQLEYKAEESYPGFYRGIYLAGYRYNLHMRPRSLLLEAGAQTNTVQEVKNAMEPFADILDQVLTGKEQQKEAAR